MLWARLARFWVGGAGVLLPSDMVLLVPELYAPPAEVTACADPPSVRVAVAVSAAAATAFVRRTSRLDLLVCVRSIASLPVSAASLPLAICHRVRCTDPGQEFAGGRFFLRPSLVAYRQGALQADDLDAAPDRR